ncbi:MAG: Maf family protein [Oligoflexia bacterium]|nr:Maf family protein [Oligoflexia bacterium]
MYQTAPKTRLILASASPRRSQLLSGVGINYEIMASGCDETPLVNETATDMVRRLALDKARFVARSHPDAWVIGADTTVVVDGEILGKPNNHADAVRMLSLLQGREHQVAGAFGIVCAARALEEVEVHTSTVHMVNLGKEAVAAYVHTGEPMDKAGAYAIQGVGAGLIEAVDGSYTNVVGLNLSALLKRLLKLQVIKLAIP